MARVVQAAHRFIEPDRDGAQRGSAPFLLRDLAHQVAREQVALAAPSLHTELREVDIELALAQVRTRTQLHLHHFGGPVGVGGEVLHLRTRGTSREVILLVACDARYREPLHVVGALRSVLIDQVVDGALVVLLPYTDMEEVLADEFLIRHFGDDHGAIGAEHDDIVDLAALVHELEVAQAPTHEALRTVHIEFAVRYGHFGGHNGIERAQLGLALAAGAELLLQLLEVVHGVVHQVVQLVLHTGQVVLQATDMLIGLERVELADTLDADLGEADHILVGHFAAQVLHMGLEAAMDEVHDLLPGLGLLDLAVHLLLDENALQAGEVPLLLQLAPFDRELQFQQAQGVLRADAQQFGHAHEAGLVVLDHHRVRRDAQLTIGEGIERIDGVVRRYARSEVDGDLDVLGRVVLDVAHLDLALVVGLDDALDQAGGGGAVGDLGDDQRLVVLLADAGPRTHAAAALALVVVAHVGQTGRGEIG